jgi:hypothetical protein
MTDTRISWNPEEIAAFTIEDIISGKRPVLYVGRDVSDGSWLFSGGGEVTADEIRLVSLADVMKIDASLNELVDLPLGWYAERPTPEAPWVREPSFSTEWDEFVSEAQEYTKDRQERLISEFSLLEWDRFEYDQETAELVFLNAGTPKVGMMIQIVGSWSAQANTWLWSWGNDSIPPSAAEHVHLLKQFGEQYDFERLKTPLWPAKEADGWEMACVACLLLQGEGVYRAPDDDGALFMVVRYPEFIDE